MARGMHNYAHDPVLATDPGASAALPQPPHVLTVGHSVEMSRIAAQLVETDVVDLQPFPQRAVSEPISYLRRWRFTLVRSIASLAKRAVAFVLSRQPRPALIFTATVDLLPEAFGFVPSLSHNWR